MRRSVRRSVGSRSVEVVDDTPGVSGRCWYNQFWLGASCSKPAWVRRFDTWKPGLEEIWPGSRRMAWVIAQRSRAEPNPLARYVILVWISSRFQVSGERVLCLLEVDIRRHSAMIPVPSATDARTVLASVWLRYDVRKWRSPAGSVRTKLSTRVSWVSCCTCVSTKRPDWQLVVRSVS